MRDETEDLGAAIRDLTSGAGVDVVFDGTGKSLFDVSISALHFKGVFVHYGRRRAHSSAEPVGST